jgi:hypothetical protein
LRRVVVVWGSGRVLQSLTFGGIELLDWVNREVRPRARGRAILINDDDDDDDIDGGGDNDNDGMMMMVMMVMMLMVMVMIDVRPLMMMSLVCNGMSESPALRVTAFEAFP